MPATEPKAQPKPFALAGVSMHDLLASCAAAAAVSRPPREPEQRKDHRTPREHREAA
ncbi:hypothetical protein ABZ614_04720 [Streptomyces sp. NPDC013178]|uniref:hypothetical protein n=1 Tax=unclassified Streptomyces TaxID=2593676 RepID=UPI0033C675D4